MLRPAFSSSRFIILIAVVVIAVFVVPCVVKIYELSRTYTCFKTLVDITRDIYIYIDLYSNSIIIDLL